LLDVKFFAALCLSILYYFDSLIKLFSDLYLAKFLDTSTKFKIHLDTSTKQTPFFPRRERETLAVAVIY